MRAAMVVAYVALEQPRLRRAKMYLVTPDYLKVRVEERRMPRLLDDAVRVPELVVEGGAL